MQSTKFENDIGKLIKSNPLFVFAMQEEAGQEFNELPTLFTGIGKVNASYHLTKKLGVSKPSIIVNLGSAGSLKYNKDSIVCCTQFVQRDMDVTPLGFDKYQTPYSLDPVVVNYGMAISGISQGICGSGDNFETKHKAEIYDVIDMESYALALIAMREEVPFLCLKYITDGADGNSTNDWQQNLINASRSFKKVIGMINKPV